MRFYPKGGTSNMQKKKLCNHILAVHITFGFLLVILACSMAFLKPARVSAADLLDNLIVKAPEKPVTNFIVQSSTLDSVTLSWTPSSDASTYYLSYWESGKPSTLVVKDDIGNRSDYKVTNLNQKKYIFQIQAANKLRTGIPVKGKAVIVEGAPDAEEPSSIVFSRLKPGYCSLYIEGLADIYKSQIRLFDASDNLLGTYGGNSTGAAIQDSCIKSNGFYAVRVRGSYDQTGGTQSCGDWTKPYYFSIPIRALKASQKNGRALLKWGRVQGAQNYTVSISKNASSGFKKTATVKNASATIAKFGSTKLKSKKTYYFKVTANLTKNGTVYTADSPVVKIKMK